VLYDIDVGGGVVASVKTRLERRAKTKVHKGTAWLPDM
jgi:hypothetical protein